MAEAPRTSGLTAALLLGAVACTPTTDLNESEKVRAYSRVGTTQGSAVAVTQDERIAVAANRTDGIVTILRLDPRRPSHEMIRDEPRVEIPFHPLHESKPWEVVIGPDDDTAYVLLRGSRKVARITGIHGPNPRPTGTMDVGSEPTSIVISPSGKRLYVANSGEGTVSVLLWDLEINEQWDLNRRLAATGRLGPLLVSDDDERGVWTGAEVAALRPGLAHPRALAMTDNGDDSDDDELLFATEFFGQPLAVHEAVPKLDVNTPNPDTSRQGLVYPILLGKGGGTAPLNSEGVAVETIPLSPIGTGFADAEGAATDCFPNQLYGATVLQDRLIVSTMCASPKGPVDPGLNGDALAANNHKTLVHPALFAVDTRSLQEVPEDALVLTSALDRSYTDDGAERDRVMPLIPSSIVVDRAEDAGKRHLYLSAFGAGAVFSVERTEAGWGEIGSAGRRFIDMGAGTLPVGSAMLSNHRALVLDDHRPKLVVIDLQQSVPVVAADTRKVDWANDPMTEPQEIVSPEVREGRRLFATGREAWSLGGDAWSSCETCHPEGLSDGLTWRFARGPRRSISLAGTYYSDGSGDQLRRILLWTANADEAHDVEGIARGVSGGVGGVVWKPYAVRPHKDCRLLYDGRSAPTLGGEASCAAPHQATYRLNLLNGSLSSISIKPTEEPCEGEGPCDINSSGDWDKIDAFLRTVRAPHAPVTLDEERRQRGEELFKQARCAGCHGGPGWTLSKVFYQPGLVANGAIPFTDPRPAMGYVDGALGLNANGLLGLLRTNDYAHPPGAPTEFDALNPPLGSTGVAAFRSAPPSTMRTEGAVLDYVYATGTYKDPPPPDQLNCAVRAVGTFPAQAMGEGPDYAGIVPAGAPPIWEGRYIKETVDGKDAYVVKLASGGAGFNIPSLLGLTASAPYFHAGNARTLEEVFDPRFSQHYQALAPGFVPTLEDIQALVSYLLSIDEDPTRRSEPIQVPSSELGFDPDLCGQFSAQ